MRYAAGAVFALTMIPLVAAQDDALVRLEARVTASVPGSAQIDRGAEFGVQPGDRVRFFPFGGATVEGEVATVGERQAWVTLLDPAAEIELGTRAELRVPERSTAVEGAGVEPEHPPWTYGDDPFTEDMPLLAEVKVPTPEERPLQFSGRWYTTYEMTSDDEGEGRDYDFLAAGLDLRWENPFERGGGLHLDMEYDRRSVDLPDEGSESEDFLRLERLSYAWGGTREVPRGWEVGRFLQHGMPQFGVLDGVEMIHRRDNGDRFGGSLGLMPEPTADFETGDDVQAAGFYRWVRGEREELSFATGFQKTWHEGESDRDLFVADLRYYPVTGWNAAASAWVDWYSGEEAKSDGLEATQLYVGVGHRWQRTGVNLTLSKLRFPELLRQEYEPVTLEQLADDEVDRISLSGWRRVTDDVRVRARADRWSDEDGDGGGGSVGVSVADLLGQRSRADFELFTNEGQFSDVFGGRVGLGWRTDVGFFDVAFEHGIYEQMDFEGSQGELDQDRLRASWDLQPGEDWDLSLYAENRFGDEQDSTTLGFFLQRSF